MGTKFARSVLSARDQAMAKLVAEETAKAVAEVLKARDAANLSRDLEPGDDREEACAEWVAWRDAFHDRKKS